MMPWDLPGLLLAKSGRVHYRTLGETLAGDPSAYDDVVLSDGQKAHYFREGYLVLRGAVPPALLDEVRAALWAEVGPASWPWAHNSFMNVDAVLDFYLFSNLPAIAAQLFGSPESDVTGPRFEGGKSAAHFWSDFHYFRPAKGAKIINYHTDSAECEGILPANHTRTSRLRFWITLDDDVTAPLMINQSFFTSRLNSTEAEHFWKGDGKGHKAVDMMEWLQSEGRFPNVSHPGIWTTLSGVKRGDLVLHSPCLIHSSPPPLGRSVAFLCATYAPGESRVFRQGNAGAPGRSCARSVPLHSEIGGSQDPCVPQVYPRDASLHKGAQLRFEVEDYAPLQSIFMWWGWRNHRLHSLLFPDARQPNHTSRSEL
eukprot:CAMPEP_0203949124 /NCGR_PEP_ID=MMETSP0359-20131031/83611_1 /ASSEMBLY_ACC=CAM_ASM_000338 /TAXON_ID=268821 /ORGANISM="Scrippsiella Hangoei, Strain SHTV-5" /LENGTH=368 /DNA_ID=CAMNT_0050880931 /DNA_START=164 /DNA_END=1270 /DNA_ORIENTATION=-